MTERRLLFRVPKSRSLSDPEKDYWKRVRNLSISLLNELKENKLLKDESEWESNEIRQMTMTIDVFNEHMRTSRALTRAFTSKNSEITKCLTSLDVGFHEKSVAVMWFDDMVSVFTASSEMLKNHFLFLLKMDGTVFKPKMTLGNIFGESQPIVTKCPRNGPPFAAEVKIDLRNALSHGLYWYSGDRDGNLENLCYADQLGGEEKHISVKGIAGTLGKQNLLTACFVDEFALLARSGYFSYN